MRRAFLPLLLLCVPTFAAQKPLEDEGEAAMQGAREIALGLIAAGAPGLSAAVAVDGDVVWAEGFGFADVERAIPVQTTTRFRVGSVAKPFTAAGLMLLVEEERLDLDEPVQTYVPDFPEKDEGVITTRLLAGHLAGIRHYQGFEFMFKNNYPDMAAGLAIFQDDALVAPPGERFSYSTYAWTLVSAAMETASGEEFLAFMDARVFRPLGMHCTVADRRGVVIPGRTTYYQLADGELAVCPEVDNSYKWAGGGFLSTATDMVRFGSAHIDPDFFGNETLEQLFTSQRTKAGEETGCGISWFLRKDEQGRAIYTHGGGSVGGTTALAIHPEIRVVAALTTNMSRGPVDMQHALQLLALFE